MTDLVVYECDDCEFQGDEHQSKGGTICLNCGGSEMTEINLGEDEDDDGQDDEDDEEVEDAA